MSGSQLNSFDVHTPVEPGITLLEASAGTGKTYQITNLVLRLVVDREVSLPRIVVVTYTKAATAELKDRVRLRLGAALRALERREAPAGDGLLERFITDAAADPEWGRGARRRLARAREEFDQAVISTIHGFCQRMLRLHAFETGAGFDRELVKDQSVVVSQVVDDWIVTRLHSVSPREARLLRACGLSQKRLAGLAKLALSDPDMRLVPAKPAISMSDWLARVAELAETLGQEGGPAHRVVDLVLKKGHFDGRALQPRVAAQRLEGLLAWLKEPDHIPEGSWLEWFSAAKLQRAARSTAAGDLAMNPLFAELASIAADGVQLRASERVLFVEHVRERVQEHHRIHGTQSYQDLLRDLDRGLRDPQRGAALTAAIRARFDAALIDEFQDTDALQWGIFGRVFGGVGDPLPDARYLYLIGDPKQAIYGFRGANVHVYLRARATAPAHRRFTMRCNYRSDAPLIEGLNALLGHPGVFGTADIDYIEVDAHHADARMVETAEDGASLAPVQLRWVDQRCMGGEPLSLLTNTELAGTLAKLCAADIVSLLSGSARISGRSPRPDDVAVLVRTHSQAADVLAALQARNVPAVVSSKRQVFATPEALSLQRWLNALASDGNESAARVLAADPLIGWSAAELPSGSGDAAGPSAQWWESWLVSLAVWRATFARQGFMAAFRSLLDHVPPWAKGRVAVGPHLLTLSQGERRMTDLLHLAELLHAWHLEHPGGLVGLKVWLARQRSDGHADPESAELRLERDDNAVKIVTVHKSKGLQYGIVYVPYAWKDEGHRVQPPLAASDPADSTVRQLILVNEGAEADRAVMGMATAAREEGVRLLYVALTRARHRCVAYWPGVKGGKGRRAYSPLAAVLHGAAPGAEAINGRVADVVGRFDKGGELAEPWAQLNELEALARRAGAQEPPCIAVTVAQSVPDTPWRPPLEVRPQIRARKLADDRVVYDGWRRHSYSALTRSDLAAQAEEMVDPAHGLGFDDDGPHRPRGEHRRHALAPPPAQTAAELAAQSDVPLAGFPAGADAGTCLHALFEFFDFSLLHPDADEAAGLAALERVAARQLARHGFADPALVKLVCETFPSVLRTPLGPLLHEQRLCDIALGDRLDELRFDFPVAGGDAHGRDQGTTSRVTAGMLRDALKLRGSSDAVPDAWVERVGELGFAPLAGMMTGSIDLVFRLRSDADDLGRWFVVDYKSNRLDPHQSARTPIAHFQFAGMRYEMAHHHYFLQYHLYALALHRFLRLRLGRHYDYDTHFGGVAYLFIRGMTGPGPVDPTRPGMRPGVFSDRPPVSVINALDAIFADPGGAA